MNEVGLGDAGQHFKEGRLSHSKLRGKSNFGIEIGSKHP